MYRLHFLHCSKLLQSCPTLWELLDGSLPGSSVLGIHQARILGGDSSRLFRLTVNRVSDGVGSRVPSLHPINAQGKRARGEAETRKGEGARLLATPWTV